MVKPFPCLKLRKENKGDPDFSPAIRLFGRRFPVDQTMPELLLELLLVAISPKKVSGSDLSEGALFPDLDMLRSWPKSAPLKYAPKARLNLKLFAFLGSSKLDTRHESHKQQSKTLIRRMAEPETLSTTGALEPTDVLKTLENLFMGFQSVGGQRTWCAMSFLPIARELIAGESIWQETKARREGVSDWEASLPCFSHNQQIFLARGGEILYLQLCNALRQEAATVQSWLSDVNIAFLNDSERDPTKLHSNLTDALVKVLDACPDTVGKLAEFLDTGIDARAAEFTDLDDQREPKFAECGWCPDESWREGLFFAVEFSRLCQAVVDPIERLELLEIACAMQVLRSLCSQAARYTVQAKNGAMGAGPLGYVWAVSDPVGRHTAVKQISRRNVNAVQRMIYDAIRHPSIRDDFPNTDDKTLTGTYREADRRYGHKLFLTLAKRLGLVVPRRGAGARFILNDRLLRYLVLSTIRPGERVTYDSFKKLLFAHHGLAVDDESIGQSCLWSGTSRLTTLGGHADDWLIEMLDASGMLIRLSDACSLVLNPFDGGEKRA